MKIRLIPKTKRAKDKLKRDGDIFTVEEIRDCVVCLNSKGMKVNPLNGNSRWIALPIDPDFDFVKVENEN